MAIHIYLVTLFAEAPEPMTTAIKLMCEKMPTTAFMQLAAVVARNFDGETDIGTVNFPGCAAPSAISQLLLELGSNLGQDAMRGKYLFAVEPNLGPREQLLRTLDAEMVFGKPSREGKALEGKRNTLMELPRCKILVGSVQDLGAVASAFSLSEHRDGTDYETFMITMKQSEPLTVILQLGGKRGSQEEKECAVEVLRNDLAQLGYVLHVSERAALKSGCTAEDAPKVWAVAMLARDDFQFKPRKECFAGDMQKVWNAIEIAPTATKDMVKHCLLDAKTRGAAPTVVESKKDMLAAYRDMHNEIYTEHNTDWPPNVQLPLTELLGQEAADAVMQLPKRMQEIIYFVEHKHQLRTQGDEKLESGLDLSMTLKQIVAREGTLSMMIPAPNASSIIWLRRGARFMTHKELLRMVGVSDDFLKGEATLEQVSSLMSGFVVASAAMASFGCWIKSAVEDRA
jgi:hypothetical protein